MKQVKTKLVPNNYVYCWLLFRYIEQCSVSVCNKAFDAKSRRRNVENGFLRKVISQKSKIRHNTQIRFLRKVISPKSKIRRRHKKKENLNYINGVHRKEN